MAIREIGYRHWEGTYTGHRWRWWTVAKAALRSTVYTKGRLFLLLIMGGIAWMMPFFLGLFWFFSTPEERAFSIGNEGSGIPTLDAALRENLMTMLEEWQWMWGVIFSATIGSRLVSNDLRSEALYIYLAKPLRRVDYVIGKLVACLLWLFPVTLLPALWVFAAVNGASNKIINVKEPGEIFLEILLVYGTFMSLCAVAAVTISSLTKRWTLALIGWIGTMFLTIPLAFIASEASRKPEWLFLSPVACTWVFAEHVWEQPVDPRFTPDWEMAAMILYGLILVTLAIFSVRIWRMEVSE